MKMRNILRRPKTTSERRLSDDHTRAKRNHRNLPTSFDDIKRGFQKSWKSHRKKQYRVVAQ